MRNTSIVAVAALMILGGVAGCAGPSEDGEGTVAFYVKDAPADDFESVFVTFTRVDVHQSGDDEDDSALNETTEPADTNETTEDGNETMDDDNETMEDDDGSDAGWRTIVDNETTLDLKQFQGDARAFLGDENITAGKYTQIRIFVDEIYGVKTSGERVNFTLPSGELKIVRPWTVEDGETTVLTVDFDLGESIKQTGNGQYMMHPTLKLTIEQGPKEGDSTATDDMDEGADGTNSTRGQGKGNNG